MAILQVKRDAVTNVSDVIHVTWVKGVHERFPCVLWFPCHHL